MSIRQAPQGEESHSPSSPRFDPKQLPMLARLMTPVSADKVVTSGATTVYLSESVPIRRSSISSTNQQLPPKSPKPARSNVVTTTVGPPLTNGPRPQLVAIGRSRSSSGSSNRPGTPSGLPQSNTPQGTIAMATVATTTSGIVLPQHDQTLPGAPALASSCPVSRPTPPFAAPRARMQHPYVNESPSWGLPSSNTPGTAPVTAAQTSVTAPSGGGQAESPLAVMAGLTRSHPNLVNDYVNLDPKSGTGVNPDRCQPMSSFASGMLHRCGRMAPTDDVSQLSSQLQSALSRLSRLEAVDRELARMQEAHECLVRSVDRQNQLEAAVRRAFEREVTQLRQDNSQLKDKLHHSLLCLNMHQQQQLSQQQQLMQPQANRGHNASLSSTTFLDSDLLKLLIGEKESRISRLEQENQRLREQLVSSSILPVAAPPPPPPPPLPATSLETTPFSLPANAGQETATGTALVSTPPFQVVPNPPLANDAYNIDFLCDQLKMSMLSVGAGTNLATSPPTVTSMGLGVTAPVGTAVPMSSASTHVT